MNETCIAELRRSRGWTQERLAEASGVTSRTIQRLERGDDASLATLSLVANALDVPVRDLFITVENDELRTGLDELDDRIRSDRDRAALVEEQQQRRDAATTGWFRLYSAVGVVATLATIACISLALLPEVGIFIIPAYWAGGRLILEFLFTSTIDPALDARYPLSSPTPRGRARRAAVRVRAAGGAADGGH